MRLDRGTQKQIAQRFKGNLDYFKKPHYWRRLRFLTILIVTLGGVAAMAVYYFLGPETFYNAGPISQPHAHFANDCQKCHEAPGRSLAKRNSFAAMDGSCLKCHKTGGEAEDSKFVLQDPQRSQGTAQAAALRHNRDEFARMARVKEGEQFRMLVKYYKMERASSSILKIHNN